MEQLNFCVQNIVEGQGIPIAITGMVIVFFALSIMTFCISLFPRIAAIVQFLGGNKNAQQAQQNAYPQGNRAGINLRSNTVNNCNQQIITTQISQVNHVPKTNVNSALVAAIAHQIYQLRK